MPKARVGACPGQELNQHCAQQLSLILILSIHYFTLLAG